MLKFSQAERSDALTFLSGLGITDTMGKVAGDAEALLGFIVRTLEFALFLSGDNPAPDSPTLRTAVAMYQLFKSGDVQVVDPAPTGPSDGSHLAFSPHWDQPTDEQLVLIGDRLRDMV